MKPMPKLDRAAYVAGMREQLEAMLGRVADAINDARDGEIIAGSDKRRFDLWTKLGLWPRVHAIVLEELQDAGLLDTSEFFADATFAEARKGGTASALPNVGSAPKLRS